jgi:hypothetical protein
MWICRERRNLKFIYGCFAYFRHSDIFAENIVLTAFGVIKKKQW